jgi:6-phosphofructokinase 1
MKRIAVLTSGGDAPGMNAALRAVVRTGIGYGFEVQGVRHGYTGLIAGEFVHMGSRDVGGIIGHGGTVLGTTRCEELRTAAGQAKAVHQLHTHEISGLIVIGGNGSQSGTLALAQRGVPVIGIASTIDNDLAAVDVTIGTMTALDTALEAIDRLRVTASSHQRAFLVEVMGRHCGYLALMAGVAGGAESILVPEGQSDPELVAEAIRSTYLRGKSHAIVVVSEGATYDAQALAAYFREHKERLGFDLRITRLGHIQRGGVPCAFDRLIATELGAAATAHLAEGRSGLLLGIVRGAVTPIVLTAAALAPKPMDARLFELAGVLAR